MENYYQKYIEILQEKNNNLVLIINKISEQMNATYNLQQNIIKHLDAISDSILYLKMELLTDSEERNSKKPILYYVGKTTALLMMILLRMTEYKNYPAVILANKNFVGEDPLYNRLKLNKIFDDIIEVNISTGRTTKLSSVFEYEKSIIDKFDTIFAKNNIALNNYHKIIVTTDMEGEFLTYLSLNNCVYYYIEPTINYFFIQSIESQKTKYETQVVFQTYFKHNALDACSKFAIPVFHCETEKCPVELQNVFEKSQRYDKSLLLKKLSQNDLDLIINTYEYKWETPKKRPNVLLSRPR